MLNTKNILIIAAGFLILFLIWYIFFPLISHNLKLAKFANSFSKVSVPQNSRPIGKVYKNIGKLTGSDGSHCDYFVGRLVLFEESESELKNFYVGKEIPIADSDDSEKFISDKEPVSISVYNLKNGREPDRFPINNLNPLKDFQAQKGLLDSDKVYLIYVLQIGENNAGGDLRCR